MKSNNLQSGIARVLKDLRQQKGITQTELAKLLKTSQSAVVRMEAGRQNFSIELLHKVSDALGSKLVSVQSSLDFQITGRQKLTGRVVTNTSKNGALGVLAASIINSGTTKINGLPQIEEVHRFLEIFESLDMKIEKLGDKTILVRPPKRMSMRGCNHEAVKKIRSALMLIGGLLHKSDPSFVMANPGGCKMGTRTISAHQFALEDMGATFSPHKQGIEVSRKKLRAAEFTFYEMSDTAAINALICASLIPGRTIMHFASYNYQVQEVCFFLQKMGVKIEGVGTSELIVHGVSDINLDVEYDLSEDPMESMMFIASAIMTNSVLRIDRCPIEFLRLELFKLQKMGLKYEIANNMAYLSKNNRTKLADIIVKPSRLKAPVDKLHAQCYPGINADNLPFFVPIAALASGQTLIHDWMWENRAIYFTELNRLGAAVTLLDPHRVIVSGASQLHSAQIVCPPALRPAMIILIAMLGAEGTSTLRNVYSINRGYEDVASRLNAAGANIKILTN